MLAHLGEAGWKVFTAREDGPRAFSAHELGVAFGIHGAGIYMRRYLVAVLLLASIQTAQAGFWDGNFMQRGCQSDTNFVNGYVTGWLDKWGADSYWVDSAWPQGTNTGTDVVRKIMLYGGIKSKFCIPRGATSGQLSDVFCKYLNDNPAKRASGADGLLDNALVEAFPCSK
ncbi:Rap1a/Tai family immunity protein [Rhizobium ruizarguesonis]|uniref:Rap1a/Tai family immunity protein n=2 Tax=Rhizobium ruizarguesonis TaxID=2081791 RepID=UPI001954B32D|nr:Rap1a/Tai family immunity protein [Rhizobium ruizarguesonis]